MALIIHLLKYVACVAVCDIGFVRYGWCQEYQNLTETISKLGSGLNDTKIVGDLPIRLPNSLKPLHYLVRLQPFINGNRSIAGYVECTFEVKKSTDKIVLHINDITTVNDTAQVRLVNASDKFPDIIKQEYDYSRQFYIATLRSHLQEGQSYIFSINYNGYLNDDMSGFFLSNYLDEHGNTKYLAATQFQPTDARKAFPCMDEPALKAKFTIEMAREDGLTTISNMPLRETVPLDSQPGWFWDQFDTTVPMSTYLVAFVVSDFGYLEANNTENYKFKVWSRKNALNTAAYANEIGPAISAYYEEFFNVPFLLPKQDLIALPDLSGWAMENWGLITFKEAYMLYDSQVAKASDKMTIAASISHEIAHQWFGNLVTPSWWTDLWLNEGFASYMEYIGLRDVQSSLRPLEQFVLIDMHLAFGVDCLANSHPISIPVEHPDEINEIFDVISYSKGASIIRMMSSFLSEETFRKGLSKYLTELSYSNAESDDLWMYLTKQGHLDGTLGSHLTVKTIMDTWTLQMGYPVVTVTRNSNGTATLKQERFLLAKSNKIYANTHEYQWWIPITFTSQREGNFTEQSPKTWMKTSEPTTTVDCLPTDNKWVIFNVGQTGYYRVNYDENNWKAISEQLVKDPTAIANVNRAQIIDDSLNLARAGKLPYGTAFKILAYLKKESEYVPLKAALNNLDYIKNTLTSTEGKELINNYLLSLVTPFYNQINFTDMLSDPYFDQLLRAEILKLDCDLGHQLCIDEAVQLYNKWMENPNNSSIISPNLKPAVYCTAIRRGGVKEWNFAWSRYEDTSVTTEKEELLRAMGCSTDQQILSRFLNLSLIPEQAIKKQDVGNIIIAMTKSEVGRAVTWQFLQTRWGDITDYLGPSAYALSEIVSSVTKYLNTEEHLKEMKSFKETWFGKFGSAARAVEQAAENLQINIEWIKDYSPTVVDWLRTNGSVD